MDKGEVINLADFRKDGVAVHRKAEENAAAQVLSQFEKDQQSAKMQMEIRELVDQVVTKHQEKLGELGFSFEEIGFLFAASVGIQLRSE